MKVNEKMSILFLLEKSKPPVDGAYPIYVRLTVNCVRAEFSFSKRVLPEQWNQETNRAIGKTAEIQALNNAIDKAKVTLQQHYDRLENQHEIVTSKMVKLSYLGKLQEEKPKEKTLLFAVDYWIVKFEEKVNKKLRSAGTLKKWKTLRNKLEAFLKDEYRKTDIDLKDIRFAFAEDFLDYLMLRDANEIGSNAAMKYVKNTKQVLKKCVERGWLMINPIQDFSCTYDQPERERLTMHEILDMYNKPVISRLREVRDVYVFCCFTGFAYSDVYHLTPEDILLGIDGKSWISKNREKTDNPETLPLLPIPREIVERYKGSPYCVAQHCLLPVNTNQRYNAYLKEIAEICNIKKHLTTHTARHTFATTVTLEHDVPIETVSKMLGHKSIRTTQIYAKITQKKVSNNMKDLENKIFTEEGLLKVS
ncbi:MAG: site-specific integrase [Mucilaginibacter sp.]